MDSIRIFSPATVANVSCGFDVLGFCLDSIGDEMLIKKSNKKGIRITHIEGFALPYKAEENVASVAALALYEQLEVNFGFEIEIYKKIKPGSGIGSSAASAAGSVFAINSLLGNPFNADELTAFAIKGEAVASKTEHADNIAPILFGGFTIVKSLQPLEILKIPTPKELYATILHPQIQIKTSESRAVLPKKIQLSKAIEQWGNFGSLVHALHTEDYALIGRSIKDVIVEPHRKKLIPLFDEVKEHAAKAGALASGISGSGPSIFSLSKGKKTALAVATELNKLYQKSGCKFNIHTSKINTEGIKILKN